MELQEAKTLKYGDELVIEYPTLYDQGTVKWIGKFEKLTHSRGGWYIHYRPRELSPPGQKMPMKYVRRAKKPVLMVFTVKGEV